MTTTTTTTTRPTSTISIFPIRFSQEPHSPDSELPTSRASRLSLQSFKSKDKGKAPLRPGAPPRPDNMGNTDADSVKTTRTMGSTPFAAYSSTRSSSTDRVNSGFNSRKNRGSLLGAASDALGLKFGRKRPIIRQPPLPIILPDVIEISAPPPDLEVEERNRLREMAAQAIGISPYMAQPDSQSQEDSTEDDDDEDALRTPADTSELRRFGNARNSESAPDFENKNLYLDTNVSSVTTPTMVSAVSSPLRHRSGSMIHARSNSITHSPIPSFPTNVLSLNPFLTCNGYLPKYTQPTSMRIFTLSSKNWKNRYVIFTSPVTLVSKGAIPTTSYLHVFKSAGPDEKELERLEINEDSVIFVAEDEVGGRRSVVKVGGLEVGGLAPKPEPGTDKAPQTIWHLQITDPSESQKWISTIKNAILGQRTVRAGLGLPSTPSAYEPRGDLDVMLSIRAQGLATTLQAKAIPSPAYDSFPPIGSPPDPNYASSISSQSVRSQSTVPKPAPAGAVSALKGLFTSRPRSNSRATSIDLDGRSSEREAEGSFSSMGNNLLKLRSNNLAPSTSSPITPPSDINSRSTLVLSGPSGKRQERKVLADRQVDQWIQPEEIDPVQLFPQKETRQNRAMSLGSLSLQPPPRRRWNSIRPTTTSPTNHEFAFTYVNRDATTTTVFERPSLDRAETEPPTSPVDFTTFAIPAQPRPRAPSLQSVSTYGSENTTSVDRSSLNTKRSSGTTNKRWSRQLPRRSTPPLGPPPAVPSNASVTKLNVHPFGLDDVPSTASTHSSARSQKSSVSTVPSFSKRTSISSSMSGASSIQSGSTSTGPTRAMRHSMPPPPKPAPTSALPPAPEPEEPSTPTPPPLPMPPALKTSFRNSVAQRAMRLSMIAPKPPPSATLPPRPDEVDPSMTSKSHHRRSSSSGKAPALDTIPEPITHSNRSSLTSPYPPPMGPLPPPPSTDTTTPSVSRHSSLKHRLRMLSAPTPSPINSAIPLPPLTKASGTTSTPSTPNGERLSFLCNSNFPEQSSSFLHMHTPVLSAIPPSRIFEEAIVDAREAPVDEGDVLDHVTSLSPPPRRHSIVKPLIDTNRGSERQVDERADSVKGNASLTPTNADENIETNDNIDDTHDANDGLRKSVDFARHPSQIFSLSPPGSVASLGPANL
ncbi:hypothetical protein CC1G_02922 [Coprinopsis cinerea okayama7|uniref:PH domain-containing protein n=1 Tax=Coprinopsis cinerea (strain Okayama-7 / 130 / ATCC MYA-4618 / FGSC 9003) TaxID=240176 RepID=A8NRR2_COPC7|nr:hypothetical protein CC1G_02922 [Coprinopsis cinerea okayama7\|eukprot:XP_001835834.2 hypothetical protein CC1G_02922 [Coprinopsis cinerea okayama7\